MYKFEINLTEQDYLAFNQYHAINSDQGKKAMMASRILYIVLSLIVVFVFYITTDGFDLFMAKAMTMMIVAVAGILLTKRMALASVKRQIKSLKKSGRLPFNATSTIVFEDDDISETTSTTQSKTAYSLVEKIVLQKLTVYIYFSAVQAYIIPNVCFANNDEKQSFIQFVKEKTNASVIEIN